MNEQELVQNYVRTFDHLVTLIHDVDDALDRLKHTSDNLGIRQHEHLKKEYVQQLADLIGKAPKAVIVQAVTY